MFPDSEGKTAAERKLPLSNKKLVVAFGTLIALCLVAGVLVFVSFNGPSVAVPNSVAQKVKSSIYLPSKLPGNYQISEDSFSFIEQDSVLVFEANDGAGGKIIFSEQSRPKGFNFEDFYKSQLSDAKTLSGTKYPSVTGKSIDGRNTLSIVTDDTWILAVTSAPISQDDMGRIAASIQKR